MNLWISLKGFSGFPRGRQQPTGFLSCGLPLQKVILHCYPDKHVLCIESQLFRNNEKLRANLAVLIYAKGQFRSTDATGRLLNGVNQIICNIYCYINLEIKLGLNLKKKVFLIELIQLFLEVCMKGQHNCFVSRENQM